jgi:hypothetical protein
VRPRAALPFAMFRSRPAAGVGCVISLRGAVSSSRCVAVTVVRFAVLIPGPSPLAEKGAVGRYVLTSFCRRLPASSRVSSRLG